MVFALGIIGTGLLAVPVLAGSAAYAVGEARRWPVGLDRKPKRARAFYATIVAATAIGALMNFTPIDPIRALIVAAMINGVVAVPVMAVMMLIATRKSAMGVFIVGGPLLWLGWLATAVMAATVAAMVVVSI
jgi:Mn2+/Fe2+ NRAMP family transporter